MTDGEALRTELIRLKPLLERTLAAALEPLVEAARKHSTYERQEALQQLLHLSDGSDCNYDRPTMGVSYALWYHPRRIHDAVQALLPIFDESGTAELDFVDLGTGTGATLWALAALETARLNCGFRPRRIRVQAHEASCVMLDAARSLWRGCDGNELTGADSVEVTWVLGSWATASSPLVSPIVVAGFLFDDSDLKRSQRVGELFARSSERLGAIEVVMMGSHGKASIFEAAVSAMASTDGWARIADAPPSALWTGPCAELGLLRRQLYSDLKEPGLQALGNAVPDWQRWGTRISRCRATATRAESLHLNDPTAVLFDDDQAAAARPDNRLTMVVGSAGSGKSRVLVERLVATLRQRRAPADVLVTTFNTKVIDQLADWFEQSIRRFETTPDRSRKAEGHTLFRSPSGWSVLFLNWDKVPGQLFSVGHRRLSSAEKDFEAVLARCAHDPAMAAWLKSQPYVTSRFLDEELRTVVYGLQATTLEKYLRVERTRRPHRPTAQSRQAIWRLLEQRSPTFVDQRIMALAAKRPKRTFSHIFVDECQDMVGADFSLLARLTGSPQQIVCFGDEAQAGHIGASYRRPGSLGNARWKVHALDGSYRLPIRVCEAVAPLATAIGDQRRRIGTAALRDGEPPDGVDLVEPDAVKSAVLGVRPIVLAGPKDSIHRQFLEVCTAYRGLLHERPMGERIAWAAEGDDFATKMLNDALVADCLEGYRVQRDTIRGVKGLERPLVVWSTRSTMPGASTAAEWAYAVMTRTTGLLVVVLSVEATETSKAIVGRLRPDRLLFWNPEAKHRYDECRKLVGSAADPLA